MDKETISAIFDGLQSLLLVLGGFYIQALSRKLEATKVLTETSVRDGKEIKALVNGPYSQALKENAELQAFKATVTRTHTDQSLADRAQETSDAHTAHSEKVTASADALTAATEAAIAAGVKVPKP